MILPRYLLTMLGSYLLFSTHLFDSILSNGGETPSALSVFITAVLLAWPVSLLWTRKTACDNSDLAERIVILQEQAKSGTIFIDGKPIKIKKD